MLFVVDARAGVTPGDEELAEILRARAQAGARAREQDRRPAPDALALEFHRLGLGDPFPLSALHGHGTGDLLDEIVDAAAGRGRAPAGRGGGDPRRDPRPAERRQVVLFNALLGARARDRLRGAGHDARRDRHRARARRPDVRARRHRRPAPQAPAAAGDRVLLGAARARGGRARRRRARADRRERGDRRAGPRRRRRRPQGAVLDARRPLEVGHLARSTIEDVRPQLERRLRQRPPFVAVSAKTGRGIERLLDRVEELYDKHTAPRSRRRELNRFLARAARGAASRRRAAGKRLNLLYGDAGRRRARRASASSSTTRASSRATTATGSRTELRERFELEGVPVVDRLRAAVVMDVVVVGGGLVGHGVRAPARRPRPRRSRSPAATPRRRARSARPGATRATCRDVDLSRDRRDDDRRGAGRGRRARRRSRCRAARSARSSRRCPGAAPVLSLTKGLDPATGERLSTLVARPPGRRALGPEHRRGDRAGPPARGRDRERGRRARAAAPGGDQLAALPRLRERRPRRRRALRAPRRT